jgi:hypothetical protein
MAYHTIKLWDIEMLSRSIYDTRWNWQNHPPHTKIKALFILKIEELVLMGRFLVKCYETT